MATAAIPTDPRSPTTPAAALAADDPAARTITSDPLVLGFALLAVGAVTLGLQLVGFVAQASLGSPLAILFAGTGLGLFVATAWAARLESRPTSGPWTTGTTLPITYLALLAAFFTSYAALVLGLTHGWFGVAAADVKDTVATFQLTWLVGFALVAIATARLPRIIPALTAGFALALALLLIGTLAPSEAANTIAGIVVLAVGLGAAYVFLSLSSAATGGPEHPLGAPLIGGEQ
ncbi:hypothetical protein AB0L40_26805 [Patulibacter sp. NPDC049589]|uniref:hypothetical protein n=1 Tax=Patulibacter sp. NPDC049589 TaxID=3154731 RepID=UPI003445D034